MNTKGKSFFDLSMKEKKRIVHDAAVASNEAQRRNNTIKGKTECTCYSYRDAQNILPSCSMR